MGSSIPSAVRVFSWQAHSCAHSCAHCTTLRHDFANWAPPPLLLTTLLGFSGSGRAQGRLPGTAGQRCALGHHKRPSSRRSTATRCGPTVATVLTVAVAPIPRPRIRARARQGQSWPAGSGGGCWRSTCPAPISRTAAWWRLAAPHLQTISFHPGAWLCRRPTSARASALCSTHRRNRRCERVSVSVTVCRPLAQSGGYE